MKKMTLGRTKAEALVKDVLAPKAVGDVLKALTSPLPFSIQTDASNKGNRKMFPFAVQYFSPEYGVANKMLDFIENSDESAAGIVALLEQSLDKFGLSLNQVTAFSADNTNVNFGIHNSVFTNLKMKHNDLLRGNCHAHILHNTVKHALDKLSIDVENVVLKVYGHFSISAKRRESLKDFCNFCDVEFQEILRHVTTRWLSLNPAIHRLMKTWSALKSYFISLGDDCPKQIRALLKLNKVSGDANEKDGDIVEVYLLFCNNIISLFEEVVKKLESNATTCVELYSIMDNFKQKLTQRRDDQFYGYLTRVKLQHLPPQDANMARTEFTAFLNTAISYVVKWFNFSEDNWLFSLQPLSLDHNTLTFNDLEKVVIKLNLINKINMDELYDECTTSNVILKKSRDAEWKTKDVAARWMSVLQGADLPNMLVIISHILSIPASTGYVERIFSRMTNKWSDTRNRCSVDLMRSELLITLNFEQSCSEFHTIVLKDKELLNAARSNKKYAWKKK